jgi:hypothetical protein
MAELNNDSDNGPERSFLKTVKIACAAITKLIIFTVIVVDVILAIATIIYAIDNDKRWLFLCWIMLAIIAVQFLRLTESDNRESKIGVISIPSKLKLVLVTLVGAISGALIWPIFDNSYGMLIGIAFGSLFGLTIELGIELITTTR